MTESFIGNNFITCVKSSKSNAKVAKTAATAMRVNRSVICRAVSKSGSQRGKSEV